MKAGERGASENKKSRMSSKLTFFLLFCVFLSVFLRGCTPDSGFEWTPGFEQKFMSVYWPLLAFACISFAASLFPVDPALSSRPGMVGLAAFLWIFLSLTFALFIFGTAPGYSSLFLNKIYGEKFKRMYVVASKKYIPSARSRHACNAVYLDEKRLGEGRF